MDKSGKRSKKSQSKSPEKSSPSKKTKQELSSQAVVPVQNGNQVLNWDKVDIDALILAIEAGLPKSDHLKFTTATEKFDWKKVSTALRNRTDQECKEKWLEIQARLRRYRTLTGK